MADLVLVDNDARIVELVAWFLRRARHTVRTAGSYAEVRALLLERRPDLMLADLELGEERGEEELSRLAAEGLLPATLVVSGYLDRDSEAALRRVPGVIGTLAKPFDLPLLERRIVECLASAPVPDAGEREPEPVLQLEVGVQPALGEEEDAEGWIEIEPAESPWVPRDGVSRGGVPRDGVPRDGVPRGGVPRDGVPRGGVPRDGVPRGGVPRDGVPPRRELP